MASSVIMQKRLQDCSRHKKNQFLEKISEILKKLLPRHLLYWINCFLWKKQRINPQQFSSNHNTNARPPLLELCGKRFFHVERASLVFKEGSLSVSISVPSKDVSIVEDLRKEIEYFEGFSLRLEEDCLRVTFEPFVEPRPSLHIKILPDDETFALVIEKEYASGTYHFSQLGA